MNNLIHKVFKYSLSFRELSEEEISEIKVEYPKIKDRLVIEIRENKMTPFVAEFMTSIGIDVDYWQEIVDEYNAKNTGLCNEIEQLLKLFMTENINKAWPVENFGVLMCTNSKLTYFDSGDIDIYVDFQYKDKVDFLMKSMGYKDENNNHWERTTYKKDDTRMVVNIMWCWQARKNIPMPTIFDCFVEGTKKNGLNQLKPEELIYQCLLHVSVHHYVKAPGLKLYFDIVLMTKKCFIDWEQVMFYAKKDGYTHRVTLSAYLSVKFLGANIPESFYKEYINELKYKDKFFNLINENTIFEKKLSRYDCFKVEAYCDNISVLKLVVKLLFPPKNWISIRYPGSNIIVCYVKNIINMFK